MEFDPPVEVLFRHCDNSNNAGLTGTVHERMKARGGTPEGSEASLRSLSQCLNRRLVRLVSASLSAVLLYIPGSSRYRRFLPPPFISRYFIQIRRRDIVHGLESAPTVLFQALSTATAYARSQTQKPHYRAKQKIDLSIREIVRHRIYLRKNTEIRDFSQ